MGEDDKSNPNTKPSKVSTSTDEWIAAPLKTRLLGAAKKYKSN